MNPASLFRLSKAVCREAAENSEKYWKKGVLIMKVSYYDLFDMIAEDAGKLLSQAEQSPIHPENYSPDNTITAVREKIKGTESHKKTRTQEYFPSAPSYRSSYPSFPVRNCIRRISV